MRKINKNLDDIPTSLIPSYPEFFTDSKIPSESKTTHKRRLETLTAASYTDTNIYNSRYKLKDIKEKLKLIYYNKCAYCEQKIELSHVEHYRYKNKYYWLAYSWGNLILACPHCNTNKGTHFELQGTNVVFTNMESEIKNINKICIDYDILEQPKMVNPEITDPEPHITFDKLGRIYSTDIRFSYTIEKCRIRRTYLNDRRKTILNKLKKEISACFFKNRDYTKRINVLKHIIENFKDNAEDIEDEEFNAFRKYAINNGWINDIVKEVAQKREN